MSHAAGALRVFQESIGDCSAHAGNLPIKTQHYDWVVQRPGCIPAMVRSQIQYLVPNRLRPLNSLSPGALADPLEQGTAPPARLSSGLSTRIRIRSRAETS